MDIRLAIVILSEYVGRYSTIRFCGMIMSTSNVRRLADLRPDVHARPTVGTTDIGSFVDVIARVGARKDGKPLLSSEAVAHVFTRANTTSNFGVGGQLLGYTDSDGRPRRMTSMDDPDGRSRPTTPTDNPDG